MKETVVKCDLCRNTINTIIVPEEKYHYKYCISKYVNNTVETDIIEKDICPDCASRISEIYDSNKGL